MKKLLGLCSAIITVVIVVAPPARADEAPPGNDTGCCVSFDDSPVNLVFCMTEDACRIEPPR